MYQLFLKTGHKVFLLLEEWLNKALTPRYNPLHYLGAIAIFFLWLLLASGFYIFLFYRISATDAYPSIEALTREQWWLGGVMRSIHRYASDGLIIATVLHTLHVYFTDRYRRFRWVAWVTGVLLFIAVIPDGIVGYWMVWDMQAQMSALLTADFLSYIPKAGEAIQRSFLSNSIITDNFFLAILLIHVLLPLYILTFLWIHVTRISRPVINPPKEMMLVIVGLMLGLSFIKPALSAPAADLTKLYTTVPVDWFYLFFYPMIHSMPGWLSWAILGAFTVLLTAAPWYVRDEKPAKAVVDLVNCTGCAQCYKDCPYEAIYMRPRTDGGHFEQEAQVIADRCASCGICVGACDFKAIDLPDRLSDSIKEMIVRLASPEVRGGGEPTIVGFVCEHSVSFKGGGKDAGLLDEAHHCLKDMPNVVILNFPCAGMIQSSMIELALKSGADGVFICGCQVGDCHFREGHQWAEGRLMHERMPYLKKGVERTRIRAFWLTSLRSKELVEGVKAFQGDLKTQKKEIPLFRTMSLKRSAIIPAIILMVLPLIPVYYLADSPYQFHPKNSAAFIFSIKHMGKRVVPCEKKSREELAKLPYRERRPMDCPPDRLPIYVQVFVDGEKKVERVVAPGGLRDDGPSIVYVRYLLKPGPHQIKVRMSDTGKADAIDYVFDGTIELKAGQVSVMDFDDRQGSFVVN